MTRRLGGNLCPFNTRSIRIGDRPWLDLSVFNLADWLLASGSLLEARSLVDKWEPSTGIALGDPLRAIGLQVAALYDGMLTALKRLTELLPHMANSPDPYDQADLAFVRATLLLMDEKPDVAFDHLADMLEGLSSGRVNRPLNLLAHTAAWSRDIRRVRRALACLAGNPGMGGYSI